MRPIAVFALLGGLVLIHPQPPQEVPIRVHILEAKTGDPVSHAEIDVGSPPSRIRAEVWGRRGYTDREGVGTIYIPSPPPDYIFVGAGWGGDEWNDCAPVRYCTGTALRKGAAGENLCWAFWHGSEPPPPLPHPEPGNIYIYAHHNGGLSLALHHLFDVPTGVPWSKQPARKDCPPVTAADLAAATRPRPPRLNAKPKPSASPAKPAPPRSQGPPH